MREKCLAQGILYPLEHVGPSGSAVQRLGGDSWRWLPLLAVPGEATGSTTYEKADKPSTCCGDAHQLPRLRMNALIAPLERVLSLGGQRGLGRRHSVLNAGAQQYDSRIGHFP